MTRYLSCADTARLVRIALKAAFPSVKFSVTSKTYSGGASMRVRWVDGPTDRDVQSITGRFVGGGFDGSIDLAYNLTHWLLPDGTTVVAHNPGTVGSRGMVAGERNHKPHDDAELVRFGADHIFTERAYTAGFLERRANKVCGRYGVPTPLIHPPTAYDGAWFPRAYDADFRNQHGRDLDELIMLEAQKTRGTTAYRGPQHTGGQSS